MKRLFSQEEIVQLFKIIENPDTKIQQIVS